MSELDPMKAAEIMFEHAAPVFRMLKAATTAVMKITPTIDGKKPVSIILVAGDEEVREVIAAITELEDKWDAEKEYVPKHPACVGDWLSDCCSAGPWGETLNDEGGNAGVGICGKCKEHASFTKSVEGA